VAEGSGEGSCRLKVFSDSHVRGADFWPESNSKRYPTKADAWKAAEGIRLYVANPPNADVVTFGALINRFLKEALPERKGTADRYPSWVLNHINPRWEQVPLSKVKPLAVEIWLKGLNLAPKSKGHIRSVMHILFE